MYNRLEFPFQPVFLFAEDMREAGYDAEMGHAFPWALLRKAHPGLGPQNGLQFP